VSFCSQNGNNPEYQEYEELLITPAIAPGRGLFPSGMSGITLLVGDRNRRIGSHTGAIP